MPKPKIYLSDRIYIPVKFIDDLEGVEHKYTEFFFEDSICNGCEYRRDRPSSVCTDECENGGLKEAVCLVNTKNIKGKQYMGFPMGDRERVERRAGINYSKFKVVDKRTLAPFEYPVKFTGKLRDYQTPVYDDWLEAGYGLVKAPPRTGKTVMSLAIGISLGHRFLIIADQKDFLDGFYETIEAMTNLPKLQDKAGKKLFGFIEKDEDYDTLQIALCTYQKFLHNTPKRMKQINKNFGTIWTDEIHRAGANCFSKFLINCTMRYRGGCSATPRRKDGRHNLVFNIVGPVVASTSIETLVPKLRVRICYATKPKRQYSGGPAAWVYAMKFLCKNEERNQMILQSVIKDIKNGRSVVLPLFYKDHIDWFVKNINEHFDRTGNRPVAAKFVGGTKDKKLRKVVIDKARNSEIMCVVGIRSLLMLGLNVPRWDTLYYALPMSNEGNWEQESSRILTPDTTGGLKKPPLIRMFVDPHLGQSIGCFKKTVGFSNGFGYKFTGWAKFNMRKMGVPFMAADGKQKMGEAQGRSMFAQAEDEVPNYVKKSAGRNGLM